MTLFLASLLVACSGAPAEKADGAEADAHDQEKGDGHDHEKGDDHDHAEGDGHDHGDKEAMAMMKPTEGAKVMFVEPKDGAKVKSPVKVKMGVEGMEVKPAGELVEGAGHHHILVDAELVPLGSAVPADETHIHFGKGQTETELELAAGEHKLSLQFADGVHRSYGEQMSTTITVTVE